MAEVKSSAEQAEINSKLKRAKSISARRTIGLFKRTAKKFLTKKGRDDFKKRAFSKVRLFCFQSKRIFRNE